VVLVRCCRPSRRGDLPTFVGFGSRCGCWMFSVVVVVVVVVGGGSYIRDDELRSFVEA
jgi:hypothetical protein